MVYSKIFCTTAVFCLIQYIGATVWAQEAPGGTLTVWDGVFTQAQADRGKTTFGTFCAECHKPDLSGEYGPQLAGNRFRTVWDAATLYELFTKIVKTMPKNTAHLPADAVPDVIAYILSQNGFPAGNRNLSAEATTLGRIRILGQNGPMPAEVGQLVRAIGCLTPGPSNAWQLTNAGPPERSRSSEPSSGAEIGGLAARSLGNRAIRLLSVDPDAQEDKGQKVEVKGLLGEDSIIVTSLQRIAQSCQ